MNKKNKLIKEITSIILMLTLTFSGIFIPQATVRAAGWLDYAQDITLGTTVTGTMKVGDYKSLNRNYYWHLYKFTMPQSGFLDVHIESADNDYFYHDALYTLSNPDVAIWSSTISHDYSSARNVYYGSTNVTLDAGEYYFAIGRYGTSDTPYYLTLSYKEPNINVTSISLDQKNLKLEPGEQATLNAAILPDNATDKTITWESSDSSVASVDNGTITARSPGTATITASSSDGEVSASCAVTVINTPAIDAFEESQPTITSLQSGKRKFTVYYESINMDYVKYQVHYKTGNGKWKVKNVSGSPTTIRSLGSKKVYSVQVRGYKSIDGSVYYSNWSKTRKVKTK